MPIFDAPSKNWTYEAIAAIYGAEDNNISRIFDNIKKDLQRRASRKDHDAVQARELLDSGWKQLVKAVKSRLSTISNEREEREEGKDENHLSPIIIDDEESEAAPARNAKNHRRKNKDVNQFWNEVESLKNNQQESEDGDSESDSDHLSIAKAVASETPACKNLESKADLKEKTVAGKIRELQADKNLLLHTRSNNQQDVNDGNETKSEFSTKSRHRTNEIWFLTSLDPTPLAFFRLTHPTNRARAIDKYMKTITLVMKNNPDNVKLKTVKIDEKTIQHDWETWLKEKKAILVGRSIHDTSISIQTDFNSVVVETFANLVKDNDVDVGENIGKGSNSDESVKKGVSGSGDVAESVDRSENCAALSEENHGASLNMGNKANHAFAVEHNVDNMKIDKIRDEFEEKDVQNDESIVCDILEESMKVSPAEKAITDIFFQTFSKSSIMDLRPNSEFSLSLDSELQEKVLHEVFDSIDRLITDELHEYLTNFFNADRGPQGWVEAVEGLVISEADSEIVKNSKKLLKDTLIRFLKAFSLAGISPLRDVSTLEGVHLNQFVHPVIDSALWIFAKINYIYGEIPFKGLKIRADGVGLLNDVVNYPLVCGEGARPAASQKKKIDDDIKNAKTMTSLYKQIVLSEADARKKLFLDLRIYGWTAFKVDVSLTMLDFRGTYRLFEVDRFDLPKDWVDMPNFVFMYEAVIKWALCVNRTREGLIVQRKKRRVGRYSEARIAKKLAYLRQS